MSDPSRLNDESSYTCDHCGEEIVVPVDLSAGAQQNYVEDCPVCCNPHVIHLEIDQDGEARIWCEPEQDRY
ncbi:MAG: CPXCG motif-containing cysteine-rich protein [Planctomycetota bacterium]